MKKEIKEKFPREWIEEDYQYNLCLSDDIDSFFSYLVLNKLKGYKIGWFYNFNSIYFADTYKEDTKCIAVDADLTNNRRCWGNHVTLENPNSANLNTIMGIGQNNYTSKFAGSTLLTILSYYNVDLSDLSEKQLELLISIDVAFKQYYFNKNLFKKYYNDILEYPMFVDIIEKHDKDYFYNIILEYKLNEHIYIKDNKLHTNIELDKLGELFPKLSFNLPKNEFKKKRDFEIIQNTYQKHEQEEIFSCARTYKNKLRYSIL
ncbi:hypothetical protein BS638_12430 [Clostridium tepidum]|uniref:Uncharacterized protein n=1 Tax=Clostridium tepidum TaxID=1962263 RepID=A0A1S9I152_9CLOT|nr:hypothetical protein [Clostridium tepidum]OOO63999.1 hypothetical protein BS638_12430 [Clostridium tepidum]